MLPVEEGSPADARPHRPGEDPAPADLPVADQRVERRPGPRVARAVFPRRDLDDDAGIRDRKSTRLNSSHGYISYAVFCLKKKKKQTVHYEEQRLVNKGGSRVSAV